MKRGGETAEDVAGLVPSLASDDARYLTGTRSTSTAD